MLTRIEIQDFKSFDRATLPLAELTVLIGANASGKSNALEAIQLLSWLAEGRRLHDLPLAIRERELAVRGLPGDLPHRRSGTGQSANGPRLGCAIRRPGEPVGELELRIELAIRDGELHVVGEELADPGSGSDFPLYRLVQPAAPGFTEIEVAYNNFARGGKKPQIKAIDQQPVFTQLLTPARFGAEHPRSQQEIPAACKAVASTLSGVFFLDPEPRVARGYVHESLRRLESDGANLSSVLRGICRDPGPRQQVLDFVRSLPEQEISGIDFVETPRGEVMVVLEETFGGRSTRYDATLLSDGTLRVLAVAAALLSVPAGTLIVIEEIDNGVHPSRARQLMEGIQRVASERSLRVLLTTHNPALLDNVPDAALPDVVVCHRDPETGASRLVRIEDLALYPELLARGTLGEIVTDRSLERAVRLGTERVGLVRQQLSWLDAQDWARP
jgi:energy-coupling factor transporter ATP-binding protein EcfA2